MREKIEPSRLERYSKRYRLACSIVIVSSLYASVEAISKMYEPMGSCHSQRLQ